MSASLVRVKGFARPVTFAKRQFLLHTRVYASAGGSESSFAEMIEQKNRENSVVVYSKTYCPYCTEVKSLFSKLDVPAKVIDLDTLADGDDIQDALVGISGMRTVPQVFIGGDLVGGCDDTLKAYRSGMLSSMLNTVGITVKDE